MKSVKSVLAGLVLLFASSSGFAAELWRDLSPAALGALGAPRIETLKARTLELDFAALTAALNRAPQEFTAAPPAELDVPMPDGTLARFKIVTTALMHPALAAKYPGIKTFVGRGVTDPTATARFDIGPRGFHGMILAPSGTVYLDPYRVNDTHHYLSYYKRDTLRRELRFADRVVGADGLPPAPRAPVSEEKRLRSFAGELRTYRLAIAATGEYSEFHDPIVPPGKLMPDKAVVLAELVNVVNRVSGIYEREVGVRMQIIPENDQLIFTNRAADPYVDGDPTGLAGGLVMVFTNTLILDTLIGPESYDIGHVASTGGGGVAGLGVVCGDRKGAGVTGLPEPVGDGYYVDFVAHEMGHQFDGNHTFNGTAGACGGNIGPTALEPGSGSTIQAYAGICGADNLQPNSDDYFHGVSFDEITTYTREDTGSTCGVLTPVANRAPIADAGPGGWVIPKDTPFELTGSASDADGDAVTAHWEQFDLGPAGAPNAPMGNAPLFRSFTPTASTTRVFPRIENLVANRRKIGEILPNYERSMQFRFIVRDNNVLSGAGGVANDMLSMKVAGNAGPFKVTAPDTATSFAPGSTLDVTWNVAGTDTAPVSCATVDISLSQDGGLTYPALLAGNVPNDGMHSIKLPNGSVERARIKVKCAGNVFFDISNADFSIGANGKAAPEGSGLLVGAVPGSLLALLLGGVFLRRFRQALELR